MSLISTKHILYTLYHYWLVCHEWNLCANVIGHGHDERTLKACISIYCQSDGVSSVGCMFMPLYWMVRIIVNIIISSLLRCGGWGDSLQTYLVKQICLYFCMLVCETMGCITCRFWHSNTTLLYFLHSQILPPVIKWPCFNRLHSYNNRRPYSNNNYR
jgi:hypothetical protein